ncbi:hypothetical protein [Methylobacterium sp. SI9]|uniref:hypothetical protein n=1 Tax=Methylobacterium guangdongense TaxID=3138811 RepID=UPI00313CEF09
MSDEDEDAREKLVANERIKFTSTYANGLAVAIFAVVSRRSSRLRYRIALTSRPYSSRWRFAGS